MPWMAINSKMRPLPGFSHATDHSESKVSGSVSQPSRHREAVLKAAASFAARWKKSGKKTAVRKRYKSARSTDNAKRPRQPEACPPESPDTTAQYYIQTRRQRQINQQKEHLKFCQSGLAGRISLTEGHNPEGDAHETQRNAAANVEIQNNEAKTAEPAPHNTESTTLDATACDDDLFADLDDSFFDGLEQGHGDSLLPMLSQSSTVCVSSTAGSSTPTTPELPNHLPSKWLMSPFLRTAYPDSLPSIKYSPIPSLTSAMKIQTCFRIAEAVRLLKGPRHTEFPVTIELFAKVTGTINNKGTQVLCFADAFFPDRPPYINGRYPYLDQQFEVRTFQSQLSSVSKPRNQSALGTSKSLEPPEQLYRAILRSTSPPASANDGRAHSATSTSYHSARNQCHVHVEAIRESSLHEIKYVRGIVDPEGAGTE